MRQACLANVKEKPYSQRFQLKRIKTDSCLASSKTQWQQTQEKESGVGDAHAKAHSGTSSASTVACATG